MWTASGFLSVKFNYENLTGNQRRRCFSAVEGVKASRGSCDDNVAIRDEYFMRFGCEVRDSQRSVVPVRNGEMKIFVSFIIGR